MTDENNYSFLAEEQNNAAGTQNTEAAAPSGRAADMAEAVTGAENAVNAASAYAADGTGSAADGAGNAVNTANGTGAENAVNAASTYAANGTGSAADGAENAVNTASTYAAAPETAAAAAFSGFTRERAKERKKKKGSRRFIRRGAGFVAAAAVFGCVAAGAFVGFNELYYHLNPSARPSYAGGSDLSAGGGSGTPQTLIAPTAVASGTSVTTSDVSDIVEQAMPSLVSISCTFRSTTSFFGYLYEGTSEGSGSGIIVGKNDSELLIATNNHVVDDAVTTTVTFPDGEQIAATVRGTEEAADLAIVSVPLADIPSDTLSSIRIASLGNSDDAKVGQMVIAIGNALGYGQTTTVGYLSAKEREITVTDSSTGKSTRYTALQVDAAINPGNSGGALLNTKGEVIGINSAKLSNTDVEGIGYAIPINDAIDILNELMNREILSEEEQGYLGVYLSETEITEEISSFYGFPSGVYIAEVVEGGAAANAGIVKGDIITAVNGVAVTTRSSLQEKVNSYRSGTQIEVTLCRLEDGEYKEHTLTVTLGSKADFD